MKKFLSSLLFIFATMLALPAFATLPDGYTELEYIESTGTQYIDTGIPSSNDVGIKIEITPMNEGYTIFGSETGGSTSRWGLTNYPSLNWCPQWGNWININAPFSLGTKYVVKFNYKNDKKFSVNNSELYSLGTTTGSNLTIKIGKTNSQNPMHARFGIVELTNGNEFIKIFVPAKRNSDNAIGMYDTVSGTFFTNAGTGTFVAGPAKCRNLFDVTKYNQTSNWTGSNYRYISIPLENGTYTFSWDTSTMPSVLYCVLQVNSDAKGTSNTMAGDAWLWHSDRTGLQRGSYTFTVTEGAAYMSCAYGSNAENISAFFNALNTVQIERGSTATDYVPFCAPPIKIATTAYNDAQFAPVEAALESAVTTIKDVVANTIVQADAIQNLQDAKQTRPDAECPAGKTCLLVQDVDGTPHWYEIITEYIPPEPNPPEPEIP